MPVDKGKYERCVFVVKAKTGYKEGTKKPKVNPWAVCHASLGKRGSKKAHMCGSKHVVKKSKKGSKKAQMKRASKKRSKSCY